MRTLVLWGVMTVVIGVFALAGFSGPTYTSPEIETVASSHV